MGLAADFIASGAWGGVELNGDLDGTATTGNILNKAERNNVLALVGILDIAENFADGLFGYFGHFCRWVGDGRGG